MITFNFAQTPITQIADAIIIEASRKNASDIHFDPRDNGLMVRLRIDGDLTDYAFIPKAYERNLTTRLKLMSGMNITESRLPQDGAIKGNFGGKNLDMRSSCLPTNEGEKIVIRILDYTRSLNGLEDLGFSPSNLVKIKKMVAAPNGIILVTGATGSGKSTTTYSMLQVLNKENTNIITVEDPIEMNIEGLNQVQVNSEIGLTFATVLRSILRQDPNVILIGEIRDSETAQIAVRAAITGHLVLSTIHTNNSLSTIERLLDMNVEKYLLSTAITGIISQRLAKTLCKKCRTRRKTTPYEKKVFKLALNKDVDEIWDVNKNGCNECNHGYKGRVALQEVLEITDEISAAINEVNTNKDDLRKLVYGTGNVTTLLQDGLNKVLEGETSFEEIYRVIEIDNDIDDSCMARMTEKQAEENEDDLKKVESSEVKEVEEKNNNTKTTITPNTKSIIGTVTKNEISNDNKVIKKDAKSLITEKEAENIKEKVVPNQKEEIIKVSSPSANKPVSSQNVQVLNKQDLNMPKVQPIITGSISKTNVQNNAPKPINNVKAPAPQIQPGVASNNQSVVKETPKTLMSDSTKTTQQQVKSTTQNTSAVQRQVVTPQVSQSTIKPVANQTLNNSSKVDTINVNNKVGVTPLNPQVKVETGSNANKIVTPNVNSTANTGATLKPQVKIETSSIVKQVNPINNVKIPTINSSNINKVDTSKTVTPPLAPPKINIFNNSNNKDTINKVDNEINKLNPIKTQSTNSNTQVIMDLIKRQNKEA